MYDDAIKFISQFRNTKLDVICVRLTDEVFRVSEGVLVVGGFGYLANEFDSTAARIAYWITLIVLSVYAGNRVGYFIYGSLASRVRERYRMLTVQSLGIVTSIGTALLVRHLLDAVIAGKGI